MMGTKNELSHFGTLGTLGIPGIVKEFHDACVSIVGSYLDGLAISSTHIGTSSQESLNYLLVSKSARNHERLVV